ncbi:MAG: geranylgeranylglycerol-phosphate geranylgeranyltransferase [Bacteroidota bacterium]
MAFLRLIRFQNLLIIALTMLGVQQAMLSEPLKIEGQMAFWLFILSTVLIAAAGNSINDYFDLRSDRLNRPDKIVIGKHLKKRWAIIIHWGFNAMAVGISIFLGFYLHSWFFLFIHLLSSTLLWSYSVYLKKVFFWSNIVIAFLVALIPLISWAYLTILDVRLEHKAMVVFFTAFAFLLTVSREIIKDMQDMEGDQLVNVQSIPLVLGAKRAKMFVAVSCGITLLLYFGFIAYYLPNHQPLFLVPLSTAVLLSALVTLLFLWNIPSNVLSLLLKISMLTGVISLFFI